jgi:hypothetical protein
VATIYGLGWTNWLRLQGCGDQDIISAGYGRRHSLLERKQ